MLSMGTYDEGAHRISLRTDEGSGEEPRQPRSWRRGPGASGSPEPGRARRPVERPHSGRSRLRADPDARRWLPHGCRRGLRRLGRGPRSRPAVRRDGHTSRGTGKPEWLPLSRRWIGVRTGVGCDGDFSRWPGRQADNVLAGALCRGRLPGWGSSGRRADGPPACDGPRTARVAAWGSGRLSHLRGGTPQNATNDERTSTRTGAPPPGMMTGPNQSRAAHEGSSDLPPPQM